MSSKRFQEKHSKIVAKVLFALFLITAFSTWQTRAEARQDAAGYAIIPVGALDPNTSSHAFILTAQRDTAGDLTTVRPLLKVGGDPAAIVFRNKSNTVYFLNTNYTELLGYQLSAAGKLTRLPGACLAVQGPYSLERNNGRLFLSPNSNILLYINWISGRVTSFSIDKKGNLTLAAILKLNYIGTAYKVDVVPSPYGCNTQLTFDNSGKFVYILQNTCASLGDMMFNVMMYGRSNHGAIYQYRILPSGELQPVNHTPIAVELSSVSYCMFNDEVHSQIYLGDSDLIATYQVKKDGGLSAVALQKKAGVDASAPSQNYDFALLPTEKGIAGAVIDPTYNLTITSGGDTATEVCVWRTANGSNPARLFKYTIESGTATPFKTDADIASILITKKKSEVRPVLTFDQNAHILYYIEFNFLDSTGKLTWQMSSFRLNADGTLSPLKRDIKLDGTVGDELLGKMVLAGQ